MKRREFFTVLGGAAAWPLAARAQQQRMPVIGYLSGRSAETDTSMLAALRRGLREAGYVEGQTIAIEYRFADGQLDRVPALMADLTRLQLAVIVAAGVRGNDTTISQQLRASKIPIVFNVGGDPVRSGLVASLNRPGGNMTGITTLLGDLTGKNFGLLQELVPSAKTVAVLADAATVNARNYREAEREAAGKLGLQTRVLIASTDNEFEVAFATLNREPVDAMLVTTNPFYVSRAKEIVALVAGHHVPAIYPRREFAEAGGLASYGYDVADGYRQMGTYAARILKGTRPADLPVLQPTKFELVINLKTAKTMGFDIPARVLALSDEVIE